MKLKILMKFFLLSSQSILNQSLNTFKMINQVLFYNNMENNKI